ncbi:hypothetical protein C8J57DRAFT_678224 [Mycena rebaudengoi]|nr:hypothetical protein C8J57DRAFT_678224 [Mycena rebaudengoi]
MFFISVEKSYIVSQVCEALCYGFFMCIFIMSVYTHLKVSRQTTHTKTLFAIACGMFIVATLHFGLTFHRTLRAVEDIQTQQGQTGLGDSHAWYSILRDVLYVTQCILGDSVAIYRCWILWDRNIRIVTLPILILIASSVSGYMACALLLRSTPETIFDSNVGDWFTIFCALAVGQTAFTTGLMACRLWWVDRRSLACNVGRSHFLSTMLLLVESAALYFALQVIVLATFVTNSNLRLIVLGAIPPVVGITFTLLAIRVAFRSRNSTVDSGTQTLTIDSITMRRISLSLGTENGTEEDKHEANESPV